MYSWGSGQNGKLGHNSENNAALPLLIEALAGVAVVSLAAGCEHSAVVDSAGMLYTFGHGDGGRLGHGDSLQCAVPTPVRAVERMGLRVARVHCGDKFTMVLADVDPRSPDTPPSSSLPVTASDSASGAPPCSCCKCSTAISGRSCGTRTSSPHRTPGVVSSR